QGLDDLHRAQGFPVYPDGNSFVQLDLQVSGSVRRSFRSHAEDKHLFPRLVPRVFENSSLMAEVPQVPVFAVNLLPRGGDGNLAGLRVIDFVFARSEVPFPPGGDDLQLRIESLVGELEPDLIVAFPGAAMGDRIRSFLFGDFDLPARDQGACERRSEQVLTLVNGARAQCGEDELADKLFTQICDDAVRGPG